MKFKLNEKELIDKIVSCFKNHEEGYDEIVELLFTEDMKKKKYSKTQQKEIIKNFFKFKEQALRKCGRNLAIGEALVWYRLTNRLMNIHESVEETLRQLGKDENINFLDMLNG